MALEQKIFHIIVEILAIIISSYFIYISKLFTGWKKYSLIIISISVILIDIYTLLSWALIVDFFPQKLFHLITEALALPAGVVLIYLSQQDIGDKWASRILLGM
jgi:hypothetical protein